MKRDSDTRYKDNLTHNSKQINEILNVLTNKLAATLEMNVH